MLFNIILTWPRKKGTRIMWFNFACKGFSGLWLCRKKIVIVKKSSSPPTGTSVPLSLFLKS